MRRVEKLPAAVTIGGSDSGGGAGIQADLKTFAAIGVHGLTVVTNITAQSPKKVRAIEPCGRTILQRQLESVYGDFRPGSTKVGMLYTAEIIRLVARMLKRVKARNVVIDPVLISTSGRPLLKPAAVAVLRKELLPLATLITPNIPEAEKLSGQRIRSLEDMNCAAQSLQHEFGCAVLVKGGHLQRGKQAMDVLFNGKEELTLSAPRVRGVRTHGTGCTYSAAIAAFLAKGESLHDSARKAKAFVTRAISRSVDVGGYSVLLWDRSR